MPDDDYLTGVPSSSYRIGACLDYGPVTGITNWLESPDGVKLFYRHWPGKSHAPVVIYLHGIEGHSLWFDSTAGKLREFGFNLYAPDRRGAGMNQADRGHLQGYRILLDDIRRFINFTRKQHPES